MTALRQRGRAGVKPAATGCSDLSTYRTMGPWSDAAGRQRGV